MVQVNDVYVILPRRGNCILGHSNLLLQRLSASLIHHAFRLKRFILHTVDLNQTVVFFLLNLEFGLHLVKTYELVVEGQRVVGVR